MSDPLNRQPPEEGSPLFYGGPMDGQPVLLPGGMPAAKIRPEPLESGWYVWSEENERYEWRP
jgi:hypothetical protein